MDEHTLCYRRLAASKKQQFMANPVAVIIWPPRRRIMYYDAVSLPEEIVLSAPAKIAAVKSPGIPGESSRNLTTKYNII